MSLRSLTGKTARVRSTWSCGIADGQIATRKSICHVVVLLIQRASWRVSWWPAQPVLAVKISNYMPLRYLSHPRRAVDLLLLVVSTCFLVEAKPSLPFRTTAVVRQVQLCEVAYWFVPTLLPDDAARVVSPHPLLSSLTTGATRIPRPRAPRSLNSLTSHQRAAVHATLCRLGKEARPIQIISLRWSQVPSRIRNAILPTDGINKSLPLGRFRQPSAVTSLRTLIGQMQSPRHGRTVPGPWRLEGLLVAEKIGLQPIQPALYKPPRPCQVTGMFVPPVWTGELCRWPWGRY